MLPRLFSGVQATAASALLFGGLKGTVAPSLLRYTLRVVLPSPSLLQAPVRFATHKASGHANDGKDGPGKRLGAKKTSGQPVKIGMIIYRQRGTVWYPGENCGIGRDHTIFAMAPGFVRYYKDPEHPKRKFIGVALTEDQKLPKPPNAARRRLLGRVEVPLVEPSLPVQPGTPLRVEDLEMKDGFYMYRPANWRIGKIMPKVEVKNNNPFTRWRKRAKRAKNYKLRRGIR